jgi:hypothetical protein
MRPLRGMGLIDVIVGSALMLIIFLGLTALLRSSLILASLAKNKATATAVAGSQMEYVRSLSYDAVGTVGGIPAGNIPQYATTTTNGIEYVSRTYIEYADDPADGLEGADTNGITTDYKRVKVTVSYFAGGRTQTVDLLSNYAPPGLETTTGGGTLRVNVVNAAGSPVPGATVQITNPSANPAVSLTTFSDASGIVYLPGAATSTDYRISITKDSYSSAQTYERNATNQNPTPGYLTVVKDQTTASTFAIDVLSALTIATFSPIATTTWTDTLDSGAQLAEQVNIVVGGGEVTLATDMAGYVSQGTARSIVVAPTYLASWSSIEAQSVTPAGTNVLVQVLDGNGALIPDSVVAGNSAGFTGAIDLTGVSPATYPSLSLRATLTTGSPLATPSLLGWTITYRRGPVPLPNIAFSLTGAKTIGSTGAGAPLYKTEVADSTNSAGERDLALEWDVYTLGLSGRDVVDACNAPPYTLPPGTTLESSLILATSTPHMALISVRDGGAPVASANVTLSRTGYSETVMTSACGAAYFGNVSSATDYTVSASAPGYTTSSVTGVTVSGKLFYVLSLD